MEKAKGNKLRSLMTAEMIKHIAVAIVKNHNHLPKDSKVFLEQQLQGKIKGSFRRPFDAPITILLPVFTKYMLEDDWLGYMVKQWAYVYSDKVEKVKTIFNKSETNSIIAPLEKAAMISKSLPEMPLIDVQIATLFIVHIPEAPKAEDQISQEPTSIKKESSEPTANVAPQLDLKSSIPDSIETIKPRVLNNKLLEWLKILAETPSADPLWDDMGEFATKISVLLKDKIDGRQSIARAALESAINQFEKECSEFLKSNAISCSWSARDCPDKDIVEATESVDKIKEAVRRYRTIEKKSKELEEKKATGLEKAKLHREVAEARQQAANEMEHIYKLINEFNMLLTAGSKLLRGEGNDGAYFGESELSASNNGTLNESQDNQNMVSIPTENTTSKSSTDTPIKKNLDVIFTSPSIIEKEVEPHTEPISISEPVLEVKPTTLVCPEKDTKEIEIEHIKQSNGMTEQVNKKTNSIISEMKATTDTEINPEIETPFWALIKSSDYAGAYWAAFSLEQAGRPSPVPSWVLSALCGANWLARGVNKVAEELIENASAHDPKELNEVQKALACSCSLTVALNHPEAGLQEWLLPITSPLSSINPLIEVVNDFAETGLSLTIEDLESSQSKANQENKLKTSSLEVSNWMNHIAVKKTRFHPATKTLHHLVRPGGELLNLLNIASNDKRERVGELVDGLQGWSRRQDLEIKIREAEREIMPRVATQEIEGSAFQEILRDMEVGIGAAKDWCSEAQALQLRSSHEKSWIREKVTSLRQGLELTIPKAIKSLEFAETTDDAVWATIATCLKSVLNDLLAFMKGTVLSGTVPPMANSGLVNGLAYRLLLEPGINLQIDSNGLPYLAEQDIGSLWQRILKNPRGKVDLIEIVSDWTKLNDFRWIDELASSSLSEDVRREIHQNGTELLEKHRFSITQEVRAAEDLLEEATIQGAINADARSEAYAKLEDIKIGIQESNPDLGKLSFDLRELCGNIERQRELVLKDRTSIWESSKQSLANLLKQQDMHRLEELVDDAWKRRDLFTLDEILPYARQALDEHSPDPVRLLLESWKPSARMMKIGIDDYLKNRELILHLLEDGKLMLPDLRAELLRDDPKLPSDLNIGKLPASRYKEVGQALVSWIELKRQQTPNSQPLNYQNAISTILFRYLGFIPVGGPEITATVENSGRNWSLWTYPAKTSDSPVQQFGSQIEGKLKVLCIWERPGLGTIQNILTEQNLEFQPVLVLYFGRLVKRQWEDMARKAQLDGLQYIVLDEVLLLCLAREYESRLPAFMRYSLPASAIMPYVPNAAGNVPKEMFFGRKQQLKELRDPSGPSLVYGGRQLGKSSLLRQLEREFDDSKNGKYSTLIEIKNIGAPGHPEQPESIWSHILQNLTHKYGKSIKGPLPTASESIRQRLIGMIDSNKTMLVLLDEADNFLTADASNNFMVTNELKRLMDRTGRHFRVIFAGLHNVQRFANIPNQPLAHLGMPVLVGPLEPPDARELIERPLNALGFLFASEGSILRILSITNYHPGLIQVFCYRLLEDLRKRPVSVPYAIKDDDIEIIARNQQTRDAIRDKFILTLALDDYYSVMVKAIVLDQSDTQGGYEKRYSLGDIGSLGRGWWEEGFCDLSIDEIRAYVIELVGLGVLTHAGEGKFRLRSPNLVRLLGTRSTIENELDDYLMGRRKPKLEWKDIDAIHPMIGAISPVLSPLTQGQIRNLRILEKEQSVFLIFGSNATGLNHVTSALMAIRDIAGNNRLNVITARNPVKDVLSIKRLIDSQKGDIEKTIICAEVDGSPKEIRSFVSESISLIAKRQTKSPFFQLLLRFGPSATASWFKNQQSEIDTFESELGKFELKLLNIPSIRTWLEKIGMSSEKENPNFVISISGGYWFLLEALEERVKALKAHPGIAQVEKEFQNELIEHSSKLRLDFRNSLGANNIKEYLPVFQKVSEIVTAKPESLEDVLILLQEVANENQTKNMLEVMSRIGWLSISDNMIDIPKVTLLALKDE